MPSRNDTSTTSKQQRPFIGDYWLGKTIGRGASGRVKLGIHRRTGELVAVKMIARSQLVSSSSTSRSVQRELAVLQLLYHPNLVELRQVLQDTFYVYFVMEYVQGGELFQVLSDRGRLPETEVRALFSQLMTGLSWCHSHHICHRDLKPENILLDKDKKNIKIADFGMSSIISPGDLLRTSCGSPHYASPEIIKGTPYDGRATDIWSTGVILYVLLTGHLPFDDPNMGRLLSKIKTGRYRRLPKYLSDEARDLLQRLLVVDPKERMTAKDVLQHSWLQPIAQLEQNQCITPTSIMAPMLTNDHSDLDGRTWETLKILWNQLPLDVIETKLAEEGYNAQKLTCQLLLQRSKRKQAQQSNNYDHTGWQEMPAPLVSPTLQPVWKDKEKEPICSNHNPVGCSDSDPALCVELPHTPNSIPLITSRSCKIETIEQVRQILWESYDPTTCALYNPRPQCMPRTLIHWIPGNPYPSPSTLKGTKAALTQAVPTYTNVHVAPPTKPTPAQKWWWGWSSSPSTSTATSISTSISSWPWKPWQMFTKERAQKNAPLDLVFDCRATSEHEAANKINQILNEQCHGKLRSRSYHGKTVWSGSMRRTSPGKIQKSLIFNA
ncbi:kinase-like domain-containing protein [Phycomyces blakesleeanus]|uniref:Kinase-like domain-containing protein n=1 Tax=Phycomyces blakesleeanus TaxID=4837 RepID=A0ABR3AI81_PHYBL